MAGDQTRGLLEQWHQGDQQALGALIDRNLGWIRGRVSRRMGNLLQAKGQATDYVQDAMVQVLQYGPKFVMSDEAQFRALMSKIIENVLRGRSDWFTAERRAASKERVLPSGTVLDMDSNGKSVMRPSESFERDESIELARLGIGLLDDEDREIVILRQWDGLSFEDIGEQLGVKADTARMRFNRALPRLAEKVELLRQGRIDQLVD